MWLDAVQYGSAEEPQAWLAAQEPGCAVPAQEGLAAMADDRVTGVKRPPDPDLPSPDPKRLKVSDAEEEAFRARVRPERPARIFPDGAMPRGVHLLLLGGMPGAGVKSIGALLRTCFESQNVAIDVIQDESLHTTPPPCQ